MMRFVFYIKADNITDPANIVNAADAAEAANCANAPLQHIKLTVVAVSKLHFKGPKHKYHT